MEEKKNKMRTSSEVGDGGSNRISRRTFLHRSLLAGAAVGVASQAFPFFSTVELAFGAENFSFVWISDTHLYPKSLNTRFVEKFQRALDDVTKLKPQPDFLIFGGDLAQLGDPVELELGEEMLKQITFKKYYIPGEHDWYLDMGATWIKKFGRSPWTFDHKGVRFIGLDTVGNAPDYWSAKKMSPQERMGHMAVLDGSVAGPWAGLGTEQLGQLEKALSGWAKDKPVIIFSHNPLYEYYPPWNFWVRDWRAVHDILRPYKNVTNIHGHTHQVLYNEIGSMRSIGMLATSWPWPYAPTGVPKLTKPMVRVDPGDIYDGVGWGKMAFAKNRADHEYMMWRKDVYAAEKVDSGTGDNENQVLSPRIADRE